MRGLIVSMVLLGALALSGVASAKNQAFSDPPFSGTAHAFGLEQSIGGGKYSAHGAWVNPTTGAHGTYNGWLSGNDGPFGCIFIDCSDPSVPACSEASGVLTFRANGQSVTLAVFRGTPASLAIISWYCLMSPTSNVRTFQLGLGAAGEPNVWANGTSTAVTRTLFFDRFDIAFG